MTVLHQLRPRSRTGREVQQHRIGGPRLTLRREARIATQQSRRNHANPAGASPSAMRVTVGSRPANFAASAAFAIRWRTRPRSNRSLRSLGVSKVDAGITTAPSFIAASITSHSGTTLPSISRMRSPRFTPSARKPLAMRLERSDSSAKVTVRGAVPDDRQRRSVGALATCQLGVEPVEGVIEMIQLRPTEPRMRRAIVGTVLEQEVACRLERLGCHCCLPIAGPAPPASGTPPRNPLRRRRHRPPPDRTTSHARRVASAIRPRPPLPATASHPSASAPP